MKENSRFYSSLGLLILLNAVVKPLWVFAIDRQVQIEVGAAEYGTYFAIFNLSIVLSFLLDWGLTNFFNRQLAISRENFARDAGTLVILRLVAAVIYTLVICLIAFVSGIRRWDILLSVVLIQVLTSMFVFFRAIITSQQWFRIDAWLSILDKLLMIILCGSFLYLPAFVGSITIERFLILQVVCTSIANIATLATLARKKFYFSFKKWWPEKYVFKTAMPFAIILLLMAFHARVDGFLLERISGAEEAGKYAASYRLLDASNTFGYLFASFLLPFIARNWAEKKNITEVALGVRHLLMLMAITISALCIFLAPWIQDLLYHHTDPGYISVLQWCLPSLLGYSLVQVYGTVLTATGRVQDFSYIMLCAVLINLALNIILIPLYGALGSCIAALASQGMAGITTMVYSNIKLSLRIHLRSWLIYIFIAISLSVFLYVSNELELNRWLTVFSTGSIALALGLATRIIDIKTWLNSVREN